MRRSINDPIVNEDDPSWRKNVQEVFGRHVIEQRNRLAGLVRKWIETDTRYPTPIYERLLDRIRRLDSAVRKDVASVALLMADQMITAVLTAFDRGDDMRSDSQCVNYAIIAQFRTPGSDEVEAELDVNRGEPVIAVWKAYNRWLNRYSPAELRPRGADDYKIEEGTGTPE